MASKSWKNYARRGFLMRSVDETQTCNRQNEVKPLTEHNMYSPYEYIPCNQFDTFSSFGASSVGCRSAPAGNAPPVARLSLL